MRRSAFIVVATGAILVAGLAVAVRSGRVPLGVPGEWEWQRVRFASTPGPLALASLAVAAYAALVGRGWRAMASGPGRAREAAWVLGLLAASVPVQALVQEGAPEGYGLSKWILALQDRGASGYYSVARDRMADPRRFLAEYPDWISRQDALHVGTHPPGLFLTARAALGLMRSRPGLARLVVDGAPGSSREAIRVFRDSDNLPRADAASLVLTGGLTLLACSASVVPIYLLARSGLSAPAAWASASFWPLAPSALMFQPAADTAFPLLSASAFALAAWAARAGGIRGAGCAVGAGLVLAAGMVFTLAFLPAGLVVGLVLLTATGRGWPRRVGPVLATGAGFLAGTLAWWGATTSDPFATWWWNQRNHARFYEQFPRSTLAWVVANPVELAVGLGLPTAAWAVAGLGSPGKVPRVAWATTFVLALLTLGGRNLSEVGRLWLPLMPPLLVAAGATFDRLGGEGRALAASAALVGVQTLALQAMIQVVYPV